MRVPDTRLRHDACRRCVRRDFAKHRGCCQNLDDAGPRVCVCAHDENAVAMKRVHAWSAYWICTTIRHARSEMPPNRPAGALKRGPQLLSTGRPATYVVRARVGASPTPCRSCSVSLSLSLSRVRTRPFRGMWRVALYLFLSLAPVTERQRRPTTFRIGARTHTHGNSTLPALHRSIRPPGLRTSIRPIKGTMPADPDTRVYTRTHTQPCRLCACCAEAM